jgi:hypothetical protein
MRQSLTDVYWKWHLKVAWFWHRGQYYNLKKIVTVARLIYNSQQWRRLQSYWPIPGPRKCEGSSVPNKPFQFKRHFKIMSKTSFVNELWSLISLSLFIIQELQINIHIPVVARSKTWICGRSLAGTAGSNPAGDMDVCVLWLLCVFSKISVLRANSSRGNLPSVVCLSVISEIQRSGGLVPLGQSRHGKRT